MYDVFLIHSNKKSDTHYCYDDIEQVKDVFAFHIDSVLVGNEAYTEQSEMLRSILSIPFKKNYTTIESLECIYYYMYHNIQSIVNCMEFQNNEERLYDLLNVCTYEFQTSHAFSISDDVRKQLMQIYAGALFNAIIPEKQLKRRWDFLVYLVQKVIADIDLRKSIIVELLMSVHFIYTTSNFDLKEKTEIIKIENAFGRLVEFEQTENGANDFRRRAEQLSLILASWADNLEKDQNMSGRMLRDFFINISSSKNKSIVNYLFQICVWGVA